MRFSLKRLILLIIFLVLVVIPFFQSGVGFVTDWWWFQQMGYAVVFKQEYITRLILGAAFGVLFFLFVYLNARIARRESTQVVDWENPIWKTIPYYDALKVFLTRFLLLALVVLAFFMGAWASSQWDVYLRFAHATPFNLSDPLFHRNIAFYVFRLPFYEFLQAFGMTALVFAIIVSGLIHLIQGEVSIRPTGVAIDNRMRAHLFSLLALIGVLFAVGYQFDAWNLLYSARGVVFGASYTDVHADLPILRYLMAASVVASLAALVQIFKRGYRVVLGGIGLIVLGVLAMAVYPEMVQKLEVVPNELNKERPYIEDVIRYTRQAYGINDVDEREFPAQNSLTADDIRQNAVTIKNIRLWDYKPLLATYAQLQEIRTYYDFVDVDNDRYTVNGEYRQVMLSPRELASENLPSRNWINEHLTYTHGYGLCMGPVNMISAEGLPQFFIKDIPPTTTTNITVTRPEIYFGELSNDYCFVKTRAEEFDYPFGEENKYTRYQGAGGVPLNSFLRKVFFALRFHDIKFLLADDLTKDTRLMFNRRVVDRVSQLLPMAQVDRSPYMVVDQGRLYWIVDAYTTTPMYPYSEPRGDVGNYIRNSIKAVVDAYNGDVRFYVSAPDDPLIQTQMKIFPGMFQPLDAMPASLRAHIRVPEYIFSVQASIYATYHMTDPQVFFNKEDLWKIPMSALGGQDQPMEPYYIIMKLPLSKEAAEAPQAHQEEEFLLMVPFTPAKKRNMIGWMAARCDAPNYGKLVVYDFPKERLVYGPQQIESLIDQEADISKQLTLWNQGGSSVIRGSLLVIPIEKSLLYVQPLYLSAAQGGQLPELKRVIVAYGNSIAMEQNLDLALAKIFGGAPSASAGAAGASAGPPGGAASTSTLQAKVPSFNMDAVIKEASDAYSRAQQALRNGDWAGYGDEMKKLQSALQRLQEKK